MYLVHFRSKALAKLRPFGRFWHTFFPTGGAGLVDQDGEDTFTIHSPVHDMNVDVSKIDPRETIYEALGGSLSPFRIEIDEVLVNSVWRFNLCIAEKYISDGGRIMLAGDAGTHSVHFTKISTF
jgi:FAD-dependent monooxygenase